MRDGLYLGIVKANGGDTPRARSTIAYTIEVNIEPGDVKRFDEVAPVSDGWPDSIDAQPIAVGRPVVVAIIDHRLQLMTTETAAYKVCP